MHDNIIAGVLVLIGLIILARTIENVADDFFEKLDELFAEG